MGRSSFLQRRISCMDKTSPFGSQSIANFQKLSLGTRGRIWILQLITTLPPNPSLNPSAVQRNGAVSHPASSCIHPASFCCWSGTCLFLQQLVGSSGVMCKPTLSFVFLLLPLITLPAFSACWWWMSQKCLSAHKLSKHWGCPEELCKVMSEMPVGLCLS